MQNETGNNFHFIDSTELDRKTNKRVQELPISNGSRERFEGAYQAPENHPKLSTIVNGIERRIEGFSFHKNEITTLLNHDSKSIIGVYFSFGINDGQDRHADGTVKGIPGITIIACGIDSQGEFVHEEGKMFDYSKPCPGNCPGGKKYELPNPFEESLPKETIAFPDNVGFIDAQELIITEREKLENPSPNDRKSQIDSDIARQFRQNYLNLPMHPTITRDTERVKGFSFPKNELETALDLNNPISDKIGIFLAFGYSQGNFNPNLDGTTVILYGVKQDGTLDETQGRVFDYSKPCPRNCPGEPGFSLPATIKRN